MILFNGSRRIIYYLQDGYSPIKAFAIFEPFFFLLLSRSKLGTLVNCVGALKSSVHR